MKKLLLVFLLIFATESYAQTETINWWVGGQAYQTTSCETGGNVTPPANPTKRGHHFTGWEVALYDFSTLDASIGGTTYFSDASSQTWSVTFDYGVVSGRSLCSVTPGAYGQIGTPAESGTGNSCWCKATGYIPNGSNIVYENSSASAAWFYRANYSSEVDCPSGCVARCVNSIRNYADLRRATFGITQ